MWREYLGPQARIIGIDLNPEMKQLEADGFHIEIGDQASPAFWRNFFTKVGSIDVLLDDGGHSNEQQIVTVYCALDHIRDGGVILIEDVHASYLERFGNPSPRSFVNWCKNQIDMINQRFDEVEKLSLNPLAEQFRDFVHSISFMIQLLRSVSTGRWRSHRRSSQIQAQSWLLSFCPAVIRKRALTWLCLRSRDGCVAGSDC